MILDCPNCKSRIKTQRDNLSPGRYYFYCPSCDNELSFDFPVITNQVVTAAPVEQGSKVNNNFDKSLSGITRNYSDLSQIIIRDRKSTPAKIKPPIPVSEKRETVKTNVKKKPAETAAESHTAGSDTFTDPRDGKVYRTVKIGNQIWMAENMNYLTKKGSWCYGNNAENGTKYGRLYDWETAQKSTPKGWHLPSKKEFEILLAKYREKAYQQLIPGGASGFDALFGGWRDNYAIFNYIGSDAVFWSATEQDDNYGFYLYVGFNRLESYVNGYYKDFAFSVRLLKDN